jgi:cell division protein FtsI (penicillin-binding protein 3)
MLNIKNEVLVRLYVVAGAVLLVAIVIAVKLFTLSVTDAAKWRRKADEQFLRWVDAPSDRGNIMASDGSLLATSLPFFDVHFDAKAEGMTDAVFEANVDSLALMLSTHIDQQYTQGEYRDWLKSLRYGDPSLTKGLRYVLVAKRLAYTKMKLLKEFPLFRLGRHKGGLIVEQKPERERPYKILAQRTIGYVREGAAPVGLEGTFDNVLGGSNGQRLMLRVPGDYYIPLNNLAEIESKPGLDVRTTLDINIQDAAEQSLLRAVERHGADHGCAIVMEVKTGKIRAMANIGRTKDGYWETFNYAVGEKVEPGSMFKLASFMAMMEDGHLDNLEEKIPVYRGKVKIFNEELVDAEPHGRDSMTIRDAFAHSSNVGTATLVQRFYGANKGQQAGFLSRLREFGLDMPTEIEVGGEEKPYFKNPENVKDAWSGTTLPWMSIGYELLLTPLQLLQFYNAVANDGRMMKPYLVEKVEQYGDVKKEYKPTVVKRSVASKKTIQQAKALLRAVVLSGTAKNINQKNFGIAGKTGTAQLNYHKLKSQNGIRHQAGFCGFFPYENPVYSCIVVVSEPKAGGYHGSEVAAPVFRDIARACFALKGELHTPINSNKPEPFTVAELPAFDAGHREDLEASMDWLGLRYLDDQAKNTEWAMLSARSADSLLLMSRNISDKLVPSVVGMGLKDAVYLLENRGCRARIQGVGRVVRQSVPPGTNANGRTPVTLYLE